MGLRLSLMRANTNKPPRSQAAWRKQMLPYKSDHDSAPGGGEQQRRRLETTTAQYAGIHRQCSHDPTLQLPLGPLVLTLKAAFLRKLMILGGDIDNLKGTFVLGSRCDVFLFFLKKTTTKNHTGLKNPFINQQIFILKKRRGRKKYRHWAQDAKQRVWTEARQRLFRKASHLHLMSYFTQYFSGKPKQDRKISLLSDTSWVSTRYQMIP